MPVDTISRNNVRVGGHGGRTLVFGHGFGTDQRAWRHVAPAFEPTHRLVYFDHVGCGGSDLGAYGDARHASLEGYAQDVLDILDEVADGPVAYVGHSIGATLGLLASIRAPDRFERLVLIGASPRFIDDGDYRGGFAPSEIEEILDLIERDQLAFADVMAPLAMQGSPQPLVDHFGDGLRQLDPTVARRFGRLAFTLDVRDRLPEVSVPSLVLQCRYDSIVPAEVGHYLHRQLRHSTLCELDASGHCPHLSHPRETAAQIARYLHVDARDDG